MIRFRDTATLALTKLRTRKVRLAITVVISGLLFTALVAASMIARGSFTSIDTFGKEGLGDRYIVSGTDTNPNYYSVFQDPKLLERAKVIQADTVAKKKAEAKRLGIPYDAASESQAVEEYPGPNGDKQQVINVQTEVGKQVIKEHFLANPAVGDKEFRANAQTFSPIGFYKNIPFPQPNEGRMQVLKEGKESFDQNFKPSGPAGGLDSFPMGWSAMSNQLLEPFILDNQTLAVGNDGSIPIVVPFNAAEQLLSMKSLPATASSADKLARTKEVREKAKSVTFTLCYRNSSSLEKVNAAISTQQEIDRNKGKRDYKRPDLIYGLPDQPCGPATIARDVRTAEQKKLESKQEEFARTFGKPAPGESKVTFRLVGIVPTGSFQNAAGVNQIISSLVTSSLGTGWYSPIEATMSNSLLASFFQDPLGKLSSLPETYYAEFATSAGAREFISKKDCSPDNSVFDKAAAEGEMPDPTKQCREEEKYFTLVPFGSNSIALETAKKNFGKFFILASLAIAVIGAIIMMGTVGRMIADSRRETAVFRAIGAKRLDIAQIYLLYTALLSILISVFAIVGGTIAALIVERKFSEEVTVQALVAYNASDLNQTFRLIDFYWPDMLLLGSIAIGVGLLSVAIPLIRNVRRNPIRDMRDDT